MERAREWDYSDSNKDIPIGIFYHVEKPTYEELILQKKNLVRSKSSTTAPPKSLKLKLKSNEANNSIFRV